MKLNSLFIQFTSLLAAIYFVLAGTGHNVVDYCCNSCESVGIEFLTHNSCGDVHHADEHPAGATGCCSTNKPPSGSMGCPVEGKCEVKRLQLDNYSLSPVVQLQESENIIERALFTDNSLLFSCFDLKAPLYYPPPEQISQTGRFILSLKSILVI